MVGIDETAAIQTKLLENLVLRAVGPRLGDFNGSLCMVSTPGHILDGMYYEATRPGGTLHRPWSERNDPIFADWKRWSSHHWTLKDGMKTVPAIARLWAEALVEKDANGWSDTNPIWRREYLGEWAADDTTNIYQYQATLEDGTPWNQWDPERLPSGFAKLPDTFSDWLYGYGLDMGSKDPFANNVFALSPSDPKRELWHVYSFGKTKMYAKLIAIHLIGEEAVEKVLRGERVDYDAPGGGCLEVTGWPAAIVADLAALGEAVIDELANVYGIRIEGAEKKGKHATIEGANGDLVDGRIKILKGSELEGQLQQLQWKRDEYGQVKEGKGDRNDHADSFIYIRRKLIAMFATGQVAPETRYADPMALDEGDASTATEFDALLNEGGFGEDWG
ncbi:MAG: hypothetical protein H0V17_12570 [Deltaproteobacteria bacterium]|nr:hypothetical protein [Deltaproteobacteria bacterium]